MIQVNIAGRTKRIFYGWVIVGVSFVNTMLTTGLSGMGFGTFVIPLQDAFGWSKTAIAGARSIMQVEQGLLGPVEGYLIDRFGPRLTMAVGMFLFGLGMMLLGVVQQLWHFYLSFMVIAVGASVGGHVTVTTATNSWFRRRRTWAMSLGSSGIGIGVVALVPVLVLLQNALGWRWAAVFAGLFIWGVGIPLAMLLRRNPESYGVAVDGDEPNKAIEPDSGTSEHGGSGGGVIDFTLSEALRTRTFWLLSIGSSLFGMVITVVMVHQFAHMEEGIGLARSSAATIVMIVGAMNATGRLIGGYLGDRMTKRFLVSGGYCLASASLLILAFATNYWQAVAYGVSFGFFWGICGAPSHSLRGEYFGRASYGKIIGTLSFVIMPGLIAGPVLVGLMADILGNYKLALSILSLLSVGASLLVLWAVPPKVPPRLSGRPVAGAQV